VLGAAEERLPITTCDAPRACRFMHSMPLREVSFHERERGNEDSVRLVAIVSPELSRETHKS